MGKLNGKVAVVTGASRGIGKGTALALAGEGMTVYVTGRTVDAGHRAAARHRGRDRGAVRCAGRKGRRRFRSM